MARNNKNKIGYVSARLKGTEDTTLTKLASLQGIGKATAIRKLLRDYAPKVIAELDTKVN
jgi:hypothetical protein